MTPTPKEQLQQMVDALRLLIAVKEHKTTLGKNDWYHQNQPLAWDAAEAALLHAPALLKWAETTCQLQRPYPELLSEDEKQAILHKAEKLWEALEENKLGGFSGINRPFLILAEFKEVIEEYGKRDVGLTWSINDLRKARPSLPPQPEEAGDANIS